MPEGMRSKVPKRGRPLSQSPAHSEPNRAMRERANRGKRRQKDLPLRGLRPCFFQVTNDCSTDCREQRKFMSSSSLRTGKDYSVSLPVDIGEPQPSDFSGADAVHGKQQECVIANLGWMVSGRRSRISRTTSQLGPEGSVSSLKFAKALELRNGLDSDENHLRCSNGHYTLV
jgi:hypothetical protein